MRVQVPAVESSNLGVTPPLLVFKTHSQTTYFPRVGSIPTLLGDVETQT